MGQLPSAMQRIRHDCDRLRLFWRLLRGRQRSQRGLDPRCHPLRAQPCWKKFRFISYLLQVRLAPLVGLEQHERKDQSPHSSGCQKYARPLNLVSRDDRIRVFQYALLKESWGRGLLFFVINFVQIACPKFLIIRRLEFGISMPEPIHDELKVETCSGKEEEIGKQQEDPWPAIVLRRCFRDLARRRPTVRGRCLRWRGGRCRRIWRGCGRLRACRLWLSTSQARQEHCGLRS